MINLLPPNLKDEYQSYLNHRFVIFFGSAAIFVLIVFMVLLGATFAFLKIQTIGLSQQREALVTSEQNREFVELNKSVAELVQQYRSAALLNDKLLPTIPILEEIIALTPTEIYLNDLNFDRTRNEIVISGFAPFRSEVIEFKDGLEKSDFFEKVVSPLDNLIKETEITFNFTVILR